MSFTQAEERFLKRLVARERRRNVTRRLRRELDAAEEASTDQLVLDNDGPAHDARRAAISGQYRPQIDQAERDERAADEDLEGEP